MLGLRITLGNTDPTYLRFIYQILFFILMIPNILLQLMQNPGKHWIIRGMVRDRFNKWKIVQKNVCGWYWRQQNTAWIIFMAEIQKNRWTKGITWSRWSDFFWIFFWWRSLCFPLLSNWNSRILKKPVESFLFHLNLRI